MKKHNYNDYKITDELLESLGFKKVNINIHNRDKILREYIRQDPLITETKINWNRLTFDDKTPYFILGSDRILQKKETGGYMLMVFSDWPFYEQLSLTQTKEHIELTGPFWVMQIFTVAQLKKMLDLLYIDYSNPKILKYIKETYDN